MDPRYRYGPPPARRSPPLHNPARASMPVNIGGNYPSIYTGDAHTLRYDDPATPRGQSAVDYRSTPAVPTPPQLHHHQHHHEHEHEHEHERQHDHHHEHQHSTQHQHPHQHQGSIPPQPVSHAYPAKDPLARSTSLHETSRPHRLSTSETAQKRPLIITTGPAGSAASGATGGGFRGPSSPSRPDHYAVPATSAAMRSRNARYSYAEPASASLDNDELRRLRERHETVSRMDSFPRARPSSVYANGPRVSVTGSSVASSIPSGLGSAAGSVPVDFGNEGFEYTRPSDLARYDLAHDGARRGRRDSFDRNYYRPSVSLTSDLNRPYPYESSTRRPVGVSSVASATGPPPTTWGFDRMNRAAASGAVPVSAGGLYDSQPMRIPPMPAPIQGPIAAPALPAVPGEQVHHPEHGIVAGPVRQRPTSVYQQSSDDYYRGYGSDVPRDMRERDRDRERGRDRTLEYYADGSVANRAFGIVVNSRDHQMRQVPSDAPYYGERRSTYADEVVDDPRQSGGREQRETRYDYDNKYGGTDRDAGRRADRDRIVVGPRRRPSDDDLYVHHPQEGLHHWDEGSRERSRDWERDRERDRERERERRHASRRNGDEEVTNSKKTRDTVATAAAAAAAVVSAATSSSRSKDSSEREARRRRDSDESPHGNENERDRRRAKPSSGKTGKSGRDKTEPTPSSSDDAPNDHTPSSSDEGDSGSKPPGTKARKSRFKLTNTDDLRALKQDLAALEAKQDKSSGKNSAKTSDSKSAKADSTAPAKDKAKTDKGEPASPDILTPSTTSSSAPPSPSSKHADAASSSRGRNKERDANKSQGKERDAGASQDKLARGRDQSEPSSRDHIVRLVSPPREKEEKKPLKGILKAPSTKFPEEPNPIREGVAPHKDDKTKQNMPPGARWTKISRKLVNPEALTIGKERFEVRDDFVIVLRVLGREEIEAYTIATAQLRDKRRKEYERTRRHEEETKDDDGHHHRSRRDENDSDYDDYYKDRERRRHNRYASESYTSGGSLEVVRSDDRPDVEYYNSHGAHRRYYRN